MVSQQLVTAKSPTNQLAEKARSKYPEGQRNRPMRRRIQRTTVAATRIANTTSRMAIVSKERGEDENQTYRPVTHIS